MTRPHNLGDLEADQWDKLQDLADRFEEACKNGPVQDLAQFLPAKEDPLRATALVELIKADLEIRWRRKEGLTLESYLERYSELGIASALSPQLIFEEYRVRHLFGDRPVLASYQVRFANQFGRLQQMVRETMPEASARPGVESGYTRGSEGSSTLRVGEAYKRIQRIGQGSFAEVWRGEAPGGIPVAIKVILRPIDHDEAKRELHSLDLIKRLRHPFLLPTYAFWFDDDRLFIAMELADCSLRERLKQCRQIGQGCLPPKELFTYIDEAAQALDFLHREHVLHRDIKPENILLLERHAKVADFGLARVLQSQHLMTATGSGTPRYMGPEIWKGKVNQQSDQYALAMTYTELRLGRSPFHSRDMTGIMFDHIERMPDLGDLPEAEKQVLLRGLAKETEARYPNCVTFAKELEQALSDVLRPARPAAKESGKESKHDPSTQVETQGGTGQKKTLPREGTDVFRTLLPGAGLDPDSSQLSEQETPNRVDAAFPTLQSHETLPSTLRIGKRRSLTKWVVASLILALLGMFGWYLVPRFDLLETEKIRLKAGEAVPFTIFVKRNHLSNPIQVSFSGVPQNVVIAKEVGSDSAPSELKIEETSVKVHAIALPDALPGEYTIKVRARSGIWQQETDLTLTVETLKYFMPPGWRKAEDSKWRDADNRIFYDKIDLVRDKMDPVRFILIPGNTEPFIAPFYMMETKVWAGLYRAFQELYAKDVNHQWDDKWKKKDAKEILFNRNDQSPIFGVPPEDANEFAQWLAGPKGRLPRIGQWDKAAGFYEANRAQGPFIGTFTRDARLDIAVLWRKATDKEIINRDPTTLARPRPVGEARDDISVFGIKDVAGNGLEFTCNVSTTDGDEELHKIKRLLKPVEIVHLRGWRYSEERPLFFEDLANSKDNPKPGDYDPDPSFRTIQFCISFRVVFEP
jgi:serine/threonine protein kinase